MAKKEKNTITVNDVEYNFDDFTDEATGRLCAVLLRSNPYMVT